jgi:lipopolysaccharide/colanic/teichoic acid biosynthesis glycosyltransferase
MGLNEAGCSMVYQTRSYAGELVGVALHPPARLPGLIQARSRSTPKFTGAGLCRVLDVMIALAAIVFLSPVFLLIAALVKLQDGGAVIFKQTRMGRGGETFTCLKFRSMRADAETYLNNLLAASPELNRQWERDHKLKRDPRITPIGEFLRKTSLDELPQLFNILAGDMSVVGPRPIVEAEIARYGRWYQYYTSVKPGLTGLWQVSGRNDVTYRRRIAMDRAFHRARSVYLYIRIVLATVPAVLQRRGSY